MLEWRAVTSFNPIWAATGSPSRKPLKVFLIINSKVLLGHQLGLLIVSLCTSSAAMVLTIKTLINRGGVGLYYTDGEWEVGITLSPKGV